ncbi:alpha-1,4-glucan--maltose-1-phosphate maltosyltransferase [Dermatophilus congolensis]|uniref:alpha-1,4-glucan--maltose-1-phosphate maltosyltransferase n=1 Tax=Dermatophilus congolensis TaxID=1863 RepID=UPI001AAE99B5|nr:alpha-1,4-glucan--maltose-1-phosphate maltosyltransferase [Dermatophilus congolensis]MBO3142166.1 alpha-1,4-glucan--maltose-1-phosphate maltosyltransferase [Dermatophilus congolensis]MBO3161841.1 alpha-1,4-glucan--maltose-1-phosphate maltosyltransferase [Dermatophilus congolensis]MBO3162441.1 alpha-1,4-glucan--maltose-1-phosphate maltosyltransferase [Dermatophilus congolensis]MBO3182755.1 alpha-1,4-glucan--maltose-1-phosphate maltosyltransferase [Dermatophilus congolensis]MBO3202395.1 alpha
MTPQLVTHSNIPTQRPLGRIPITGLSPVVENGAYPTKSVVDEQFAISANVFREGHDAVNANVVLTDPEGTEHTIPMTCTNPGLMLWEATVSADCPGSWSYRVEGWSDPYATWQHDAVIKVEAGIDVDLMLEEGARVLERALTVPGRPRPGIEAVKAGICTLRNQSLAPATRLAGGTDPRVEDELTARPLRDWVTASPTINWLVERKRALTGAWYEFFPRSEGCYFDKTNGKWVTGTLRTAAKRLPAIAGMGFDVIYLTPIHPIGTTNRKGPNNTLNAGPEDPGSPYAIGSAAGGHDAIEPSLGTFKDFDYFVAEASRLGLEVALDIALQCSPDHPWVSKHPEWFTTRADGSIAYAENPPKKYQDIYPLNFDNDPAGIYAEIRRVIQVWIDHGVKIFRVDNPHTKPVEFWQWLINDVAKDHPDVIWLAEAFTKPPMMATLAKVGFQQSYTYYAWRNTAEEIAEYMAELTDDTTGSAAYMRPSFWPTTHDILTPYMQFGGPTAWKLRATLAATLSPTYGIYAGYELMESVPRPGAEEQIDNEKYEFKNRDWASYAPGGERAGQLWMADYLGKLNRIRREHNALDWLRNYTPHTTDDPEVLCFSKRRVEGPHEDTIIVVANTDPHSMRGTMIHLDMEALGLKKDERFIAKDLITESEWEWGNENYVRLGVDWEPVHVISVRRF